MDRDHSILGRIIVPEERHLLRPFEVGNSEIQVTRPYFYKHFFLEKLVDAHASSASTWRRPCVLTHSEVIFVTNLSYLDSSDTIGRSMILYTSNTNKRGVVYKSVR